MNVVHTYACPFTGNVGEAHVVEWGVRLVHEFSRRDAGKYDKDDVDNFISGFTSRSPSENAYGVSSLKKWYDEDRETRDESENESEERPTKKTKPDGDNNVLFEVTLKLMKSIGKRVAVTAGGEILWFREGRWRTMVDGDLALYMVDTDERVAKWGKHLSSVGTIMRYLAIAVNTEKGKDAVQTRGPFIKELIAERGVGKLSFTDLCYDFATGATEPVTHLNTGLCAVSRPFPARDESAITKVKKVIQDALPDDDDRRLFLRLCARAIAGHVEDNTFIFLEGPAGNAKSTIVNFIVKAFPGVCATFSGGNLASRRTDDVDAANAWLIPLEGKRFCLSDEIVTDTLNGNRIKVAALGDIASVGARRLYENGKEVVVTATFAAAVNKIPNIKPFDKGVARRILRIPFKVTFLPQGDATLNETDPDGEGSATPEETNPLVKVAEKDKAKALRRDVDYHNALFYVLAEAYNYEELDAEKIKAYRYAESEKGAAETPVIVISESSIDDLFEFTGNDEDVVANDDILRACKTVTVFAKMVPSQIYSILHSKGARDSGGKRIRVKRDGQSVQRHYHAGLKIKIVI